MKKLLLMAVVMIIIVGCGEKPRENSVWREDFRIEHLPWKTILGSSEWLTDEGIGIIKGHAPYEKVAIVDRDWDKEGFVIDSQLRLGEKGEAGAVLGYKDEKNYWRITLDHSQNRIALLKREGGIDTVKAEGSISLSHKEFHSLVIILTKVLLKVQCDNLTVFEVGRPADLEGRVGIYAGIVSPNNTPLYVNFDHFEVKPVP